MLNTVQSERLEYLRKTMITDSLPTPPPPHFHYSEHSFVFQYQRYQKYGTQENILRAGGVLCPGTNCEQPILLEDPNQKRIRCTNENCRVNLVNLWQNVNHGLRKYALSL